MKTCKELKNELLEDAEFRAYYEEMLIARTVAQSIVKHRCSKNWTIGELAKHSRIRARKIRNYEILDELPSLETLNRLAKAMGCTVKVDFVPFSERALKIAK